MDCFCFVFCFVFCLFVCLFFFFAIEVAPQITAHPRSTTKTEGQNVILSCNATGDPALLIFWTKSGSIISTSSGDSRISFGADNKTLAIMNVTRADSGQYRCMANSSAGEIIYNAATLNVQCKYSKLLLRVSYFHFQAFQDGLGAQLVSD